MKKQNTVIIIAGPTASGKTDFSLQLASHFNTSIISADSRQCYKELNIGVAKPSVESLNSIKHYFINSHSIHDIVNSQTFEVYAIKAAEEIFKNNNIAVMVGGTGMYIKAFTEGLDAVPEPDFEIRNKIVKNYQENGLVWLQKEVEKNDPEFWYEAEQQNPQRLMRALEVFYATGRSILFFRKQHKLTRPFKILKLGLDITKEQLHNNIDDRVNKMIEAGLITEAELLERYKHLNALQTVGYKEIFEHLGGKITMLTAMEKIKTHTKQYAKRQLTWFKKDKQINWAGTQILTRLIRTNTFLSE